MKKLFLPLLLLLAALAPAAQASHSLGTCDLTYSSGDPEALVEAAANHTTVCFNTGTYTSPSSSYDFDFNGQTDTIIRASTGHSVTFSGALKVADDSDRLHFFGLQLVAAPLDCDSNVTDSTCSNLSATHYLNGDELKFERVNITNGGAEVSCVHSGNQSGSPDAHAHNVEIAYSRIFDCGFDGEHDHGVYLGHGKGWSIHDNFCYANGSRCLATHGNGSGEFTQNVVSQNCVKHNNGPDSSCYANILFSGGVDNMDIHDNVVVYPTVHGTSYFWNVALGNDYAGEAGNRFDDNCVRRTNGAGGWVSGIHSDVPAEIESATGNITADPDFSTDIWSGYQSFLLTQRNYFVGEGPGSPGDAACLSKDPDGAVGAY